MNHWIFIVTNQKHNNETTPASEIYRIRMSQNFWGLGQSTPNRRALAAGDRVVFYLATPENTFAGTATIAGENFRLTPAQFDRYARPGAPYKTEFGVNLTDIHIWDEPKSARDLVPHLTFIENKPKWGVYFQGGVRGLDEADFQRILGHSEADHTSATDLDLQEEFTVAQQFALESHLEEFMYANWSRIAWPRDLVLYEADTSNGRQFPAGAWSIDFLAIDRTTNDFVVIELKRGQTSDVTVGQALRYMGWVRQNLAAPGQNVHGIIVCQDIDDALRYAVAGVPAITVMTYQVNFNLTAVNT